jgi:hypothetical protein
MQTGLSRHPSAAISMWQAVACLAASEAVPRQRCGGTIGRWCHDWWALPVLDPPPPAKVAQARGDKDCPGGCNGAGSCNHDLGVCQCPAGWKGGDCRMPKLRPCTHRWSTPDDPVGEPVVGSSRAMLDTLGGLLDLPGRAFLPSTSLNPFSIHHPPQSVSPTYQSQSHINERKEDRDLTVPGWTASRCSGVSLLLSPLTSVPACSWQVLQDAELLAKLHWDALLGIHWTRSDPWMPLETLQKQQCTTDVSSNCPFPWSRASA